MPKRIKMSLTPLYEQLLIAVEKNLPEKVEQILETHGKEKFKLINSQSIYVIPATKDGMDPAVEEKIIMVAARLGHFECVWQIASFAEPVTEFNDRYYLYGSVLETVIANNQNELAILLVTQGALINSEHLKLVIERNNAELITFFFNLNLFAIHEPVEMINSQPGCTRWIYLSTLAAQLERWEAMSAILKLIPKENEDFRYSFYHEALEVMCNLQQCDYIAVSVLIEGLSCLSTPEKKNQYIAQYMERALKNNNRQMVAALLHYTNDPQLLANQSEVMVAARKISLHHEHVMARSLLTLFMIAKYPTQTSAFCRLLPNTILENILSFITADAHPHQKTIRARSNYMPALFKWYKEQKPCLEQQEMKNTAPVGWLKRFTSVKRPTITILPPPAPPEPPAPSEPQNEPKGKPPTPSSP